MEIKMGDWQQSPIELLLVECVFTSRLRLEQRLEHSKDMAEAIPVGSSQAVGWIVGWTLQKQKLCLQPDP
jgi:hypothetical protein